MNIQHVDMVAGEDRTITFTGKDSAQEVVNLTGGTITWKMARNLKDTYEVTKTGTIITAASGTFSVALTDTDTDDLSGDYQHLATVTISGTTTALVGGRIRIRDRIE